MRHIIVFLEIRDDIAEDSSDYYYPKSFCRVLSEHQATIQLLRCIRRPVTRQISAYMKSIANAYPYAVSRMQLFVRYHLKDYRLTRDERTPLFLRINAILNVLDH